MEFLPEAPSEPLWKGRDQGEEGTREMTAGDRLSRRKHLKSGLWRSQPEAERRLSLAWR